jgi:hypothetical protein
VGCGAKVTLWGGLALAVFLIATPASAQDDVLVAVDSGSHIQPIARVVKGQWLSISPAREDLLRAATRQWVRWYTAGTSVPIRTSADDVTHSCDARGTLRVANSPLHPSEIRDASHVGLAVAGDVRVDSVRRVEVGDARWNRVEAAIRRLFQEREHEQRLSPGNVARIPVTIDALYATGERASQLYYFEASKSVPDESSGDPDVDPKGILRITVAGWLRDSAAGMVPAGTKSELHWEQLDESRAARTEADLIPLGIVQRGDQRIWVMKSAADTRARFALYEVTASRARTVLTMREGGC